MDTDLASSSREEFVAEVKRSRDGIRARHDATEHGLCWHQPELWALLPERMGPRPKVPDGPQFLRGCVRYRQSLDEQLSDARRTEREFEGGKG